MGYPKLTVFCIQYLRPQNPFTELVNLTNLHSNSLTDFCGDVTRIEIEAEAESEYSEPMVLIGMYISVASILCTLAMTLDLFNGFRNRNFWFPTKYFSLNAASITVITVAMKLPVDMTSPMPGRLDQIGKFGSLTFMFTIMSNLMPSLASMDNKSLVSNIVALSILVITLSVNAIIQIRTHVIGLYDLVGCRSWFSFFVSVLMIILPYIYLCMLLFLLIIFISSAITIPTSKRILEIKYQAIRKTILVDQNQQQNHLISSVDELRLLVKKYWIMAETGSPQFVMASNPLSSACSVICVISLLLYIFAVLYLVLFQGGPYLSLTKTTSVYKWSMIAIVATQFIGVFVGSIAPIFRCFTFLSFKSSIANKEKRNQILVFKVDKYWTQTLFEWKESRIISVLSSGRRSKALLHRLKNRILWFFIRFQRAVVVLCKIIRLLPFGVAFLFIHILRIFNSAKKMLSFNNTSTNASSSSTVDSHEDDLSEYVLLLEDNMQLANKTMQGISDSMNRLIHRAEKKQNKNLLKLLELSVEEYNASNGIVTFDNDDQNFQSQISNIEHVNSWSLPIISLTCITIALPNIEKDRVDDLFKSVGEGLLYTHLVEKILNKESMYVNIRRATLELWHEVEVNHKWLNNTLERNAYKEKTPRDIITSFAQIAENVLDEFINTSSTNGDHLMENENLPPKVIVANSMYRIAKTIESNNSNIVDEEELFTQLCGMIADILATCFTNIPRAISMRCHESTVIEKREARVAAAIDFLGRTTDVIERLENRRLPNMDHEKMAYIDEWRLHFKHP